MQISWRARPRVVNVIRSVVRLEPVKASAKTSKALGTSSVLTPVRRSTRTEKHAPEATRELLAATDYAYVPNPVLPQPSAPAQPPGGMPAARDPSAAPPPLCSAVSHAMCHRMLTISHAVCYRMCAVSHTMYYRMLIIARVLRTHIY